MEILANIILFIAIAFVVLSIASTRSKVCNGEITIPPVIAAVLLFGIFIIIVLATGLSPFHLLWMFPLSFVVGTFSLAFPPIVAVVLSFTVLLLMTGRREKEEEVEEIETIGKRKRFSINEIEVIEGVEWTEKPKRPQRPKKSRR